MPRYMITGEMTISVHVYVDAKNAKEAIEASKDMPFQLFCNQCANGADDEWSTSGELDGTPKKLKAHLDDDEVEE